MDVLIGRDLVEFLDFLGLNKERVEENLKAAAGSQDATGRTLPSFSSMKKTLERWLAGSVGSTKPKSDSVLLAVCGFKTEAEYEQKLLEFRAEAESRKKMATMRKAYDDITAYLKQLGAEKIDGFRQVSAQFLVGTRIVDSQRLAPPETVQAFEYWVQPLMNRARELDEQLSAIDAYHDFQRLRQQRSEAGQGDKKPDGEKGTPEKA